MSNAYIDIKVFDWTGNDTLSTYALDQTPLLFIPEYVVKENTKNNVVWDFGDGTFSKETSAYKTYTFPGYYTVKVVVFDCNNNAILSTVEKEIKVYDFLPLTFRVDPNNSLSSFCGQTSEQFLATVTYPYYQEPLSIYYSVSGSNSNDYWEVEHLKYSHLENTYGLYDLFYNNNIKSYQYRNIDKITPPTVKIYAKKENGSIIICDEADSDSFYVGCSGSHVFFYKDDLPSDSILIDLKYDKTKYQVPTYTNYVDYINNLGITIPFKVVDGSPYELSITSNGMDGEYFPISSFDIFNIKFFGSKIPFVVKVKDSDGFSYKNCDTLQLSDINVVVLSGSVPLDTSYYAVSSLNHMFADQNTNGAFVGYVQFNDQPDILTNIALSANTIVNFTSLSGESSRFKVLYPSYYDMYKKNESFIPSQTLRDVSFQEILLGNNILYDEFFGKVLGDEDYDHETIGLKIFEKIANFVANTQDPDVSEIEFLNSMVKFLGYNDIGDENYIYPEKIKRLINILSINKNKLIGEFNKFRDNLNPKGDTQKLTFGTNLGSMIDTKTYVVSAGTDIVALEKFSNEYVRLNTLQPPLSSLLQKFSYEIDSRADVGMTKLVNGSVYSTQDHVNSIYIRNQNLWCRDVDITCVSPWNSQYINKRAGTLVTPRHVLLAAHYPIDANANIRFVDNNNNVYERTIVKTVMHPDYVGDPEYYPDLFIGVLNQDLPSEITPTEVLPKNWNTFSGNLSSSPALVFDQEEKALITNFQLFETTSKKTLQFYYPLQPNRFIFSESLIPGDSGNPVFFIQKGKVVLTTVLTYGGAGKGTAISEFIDDINNMIADADGLAGISSVDNSDWPNDGTHYLLKEANLLYQDRYMLTDYNSDWGWPLVLPSPFDTNDFDKYYLFFEYNYAYDNTLLGGVIDFDNSKTTIPLSSTYIEYYQDGGIMDILFMDTLYQSLSLIQ